MQIIRYKMKRDLGELYTMEAFSDFSSYREKVGLDSVANIEGHLTLFAAVPSPRGERHKGSRQCDPAEPSNRSQKSCAAN